jgi:hypothetical protein
MSHPWFLESFRRKQLISRLIANDVAETKKDRCRSLTTNDEGSSVSLVSCEESEGTVAHLLPDKGEYPNIVTVKLFDD